MKDADVSDKWGVVEVLSVPNELGLEVEDRIVIHFVLSKKTVEENMLVSSFSVCCGLIVEVA